MNYSETRPWGVFENILDENICKVKKITILPNQSPSYQYHFKRSEVWVIIQGKGELKLDGEICQISQGDVLQIPKKSKHQIKNVGIENLIFIEVQLGESFDEDDIVRIEDNYGRV